MTNSLAQESAPGQQAVLEDEGVYWTDYFIDRIPEEIRATFTNRQIQALRDAAHQQWGSHPINLRFSLPFVLRRYYITIVGGMEQRNHQRRKAERHLHPVRTLGNIFFVGASAAMIYFVIIGGLLLYSSVLEF